MDEKIMTCTTRLPMVHGTIITIECYIATEDYCDEDTKEIIETLSQYLNNTILKSQKYFEVKS